MPKIEVGVPAMGKDGQEVIQAIIDLKRQAQVVAWTRAIHSDIDASLSCEAEAVAISVAASDIQLKNKLQKTRAWALNQIKEVIRYAKQQGLSYISIGAEDASRADDDFLIQLARLVQEEGVNRFRYCDTLGILDPFRTYDKIKHLIKQVPEIGRAHV